jgi:SAM-dependent methyltransferase
MRRGRRIAGRRSNGMTKLAERLLERYFDDQDHPYRILEREVAARLRPDHALLDAGCGRTAPVLASYRGKAQRLIGVDLVDFEGAAPGLELINSDLGRIPIDDGCIDVVMCRSVMEHIERPAEVYAEMFRVLKPGGVFIFLTANLWDYTALIAKAVPNRFHPWIVARTEGRKEHDVFPVRYRSNTRRTVHALARDAGFDVASFRYLGQYPGYFMFNGFLFLLATGYEKLLQRFKTLEWLRGWILVTLRKP